jgi:hypothetical protein
MWVSFAALALSAASLAVSALAFRAGGPRLRLQVAQLPINAANNPFRRGAGVRLTVVNSGRAAVSVERFHITPYGNREPVLTVRDVNGPLLPFRLEAHASEIWYVDALPVARDYDEKIRGGLRPNSSWPSQFRFTVAAGNGKRASTRTTLDALRIIADSDP